MILSWMTQSHGQSFYSESMSLRTKCKIFLSSMLLDFLLSDFNILPKWEEDFRNVCQGKASFLEKSMILKENHDLPVCYFLPFLNDLS